MTFRLGLTGSIGMGKSTTARMFAEAGCAVWDADAAVARLYAEGGAGVPAIRAIRPEAVRGGRVDRDALRDWIASDDDALGRIEAAIHPLVRADRDRFARGAEAPVAVFDIPLLFETGAADAFDAVAVVTAPPEEQARRVLSREGMTPARFAHLLSKQLPDAEKRRRADHVIETSTMNGARAQVQDVLEMIDRRHHA